MALKSWPALIAPFHALITSCPGILAIHANIFANKLAPNVRNNKPRKPPFVLLLYLWLLR